jgi:hypothetical protein
MFEEVFNKAMTIKKITPLPGGHILQVVFSNMESAVVDFEAIINKSKALSNRRH